MVRLLVLYGHPTDPAAFDKYYQDRHIPIAKRMKGLRKWTVGKVQVKPGEERLPTTTSPTSSWRAARSSSDCSHLRKDKPPSPTCRTMRRGRDVFVYGD